MARGRSRWVKGRDRETFLYYCDSSSLSLSLLLPFRLPLLLDAAAAAAALPTPACLSSLSRDLLMHEVMVLVLAPTLRRSRHAGYFPGPSAMENFRNGMILSNRSEPCLRSGKFTI